MLFLMSCPETSQIGGRWSSGVNTLGSGAAVSDETWTRTLGQAPGALWEKGTGLLWDFGSDAVLLLGPYTGHHSRSQVLNVHLWGRREVTELGCKPSVRCAGLQPDLSHGKGAKTWQTPLEHIQAIWIHELLLQRGQGCQSCLAMWHSQQAGAGHWGLIVICFT